MTSYKQGRVVVMLKGRFAGKKALVLKNYDEGTKARKFPHALLVGLKQAGRKVTRRMSAKTIERKTKIGVFVKHINHSHFMPTRYRVREFDFKDILKEEAIEEAHKDRKKAKELNRAVWKVLQDKYRNLPEANEKTGHIRYFFKKLRF